MKRYNIPTRKKSITSEYFVAYAREGCWYFANFQSATEREQWILEVELENASTVAIVLNMNDLLSELEGGTV